MKKFFTMLGAALMMGSFSANADKVEVWVSYWDSTNNDYVYENSFETDIVRNEDGSYSLQDFFNSGYPASFTFEQPEVYGYNPLKMCKTIFLYPGYSYPYLMTTEDFELDADGWPVNNDAYLTCYSYSTDGTPTELWYPYVDDTGDPTYSSFVSRMDPEEDGADYYASIVLSATLSDGSFSPWYYLNFVFNELEPAAVKNITIDTNVPVEYYNLNGVRVDNPSNGIFIVKKGNKVSKQVIR